MFDEPFVPPPDVVRSDPPAPAIGDVWCKKQYAGIGNSSIGRVDVVDVFNLQGNPMVKFTARYGTAAERGVVMMSVRAFHDLYVPKALSENPR